MKILQIRFRNLNSLTEGWTIDFTAAEFISDGIFAIIGPTGAGKTTILDALCLALYGRTPRLKLIGKSANEIMTRQTGDCSAEVEFMTAKGHYRCHWSQHRARRSATGELQPQKHEIVDCSDDRVLETKIKQVAARVIAVTGMNYEQFSRSIMLAQGDFNTFLQAGPDERAPLLEQITGTEMYSRISRKVHERRNEQKDRLTLLSGELAGFSILAPAELEEIETELAAKEDDAKTVTGELEQTRLQLEWLDTISNLAAELAEKKAQDHELKNSWQEMAPERERLLLAKKADALQPAHFALCQLRSEQQQEAEELSQTTTFLAELEKDLEERNKRNSKSLQNLEKQKNDQEQMSALYQQVRSLDQDIDNKEQALARLEQDQKKEKSRRSELQADLAELQKTLSKVVKEQQQLEQFSNTHQNDALLLAAYSGILEQLASYTRHTDELNQKQQRILTLTATLEELGKQVDNGEELAKEIQTQLQTYVDRQQQRDKTLTNVLAGKEPAWVYNQVSHLNDEHHRLKEYQRLYLQHQSSTQEISALTVRLSNTEATLHQRRRDHLTVSQALEMQKQAVDKQRQILFLTTKIQSYDQQRELLEKDTPCPLCGSLDHPYADSEIPEKSAAQTALSKEEQRLESTQTQANKLQLELSQAESQLDELAKQRQQKHDELTEHDAALKEQGKMYYHAPDIDRAEAIAQLLKGNQTRQQQLDKTRKEMEALQNESAGEEKQQAELTAKLHAAEQQLQRNQSSLDNCRDQLQLLQKDKKEIEGDISSRKQQLERLLKPYTATPVSADSLQAIQQDLKQRRDAWQTNEKSLHALSAKMVELESDITKEQALLDNQEAICGKLLAECRQQQQILTNQKRVRHEMFADKVVVTEERRLQQSLKAAEDEVAACHQQITSATQQISGMAERKRVLTKRTSLRQERITKEQKAFISAIGEAEFASEDEFSNALLATDEYQSRRKSVRDLQTRLDSNTAVIKEKELAFGEQHEKKLTDKTADHLRSGIAEHTEQLGKLQQEIGSLKQRLEENAKRTTQQAAKQQTFRAQQQEFERWSRLHELIGSSDGKKFRNFAQGLTFEIMISHANRSLQQMSDRYLLAHDSTKPLELHVIDNYQAGEIRSTMNLSGGESFIVSLALALGLSNMASNNLQVDSLFLDEGFGTLDEDALQTALDTLSSLKQEGKLIGIISHVGELQERIATQIRVEKGLGGRSTLSGPGVDRWQPDAT